MKLRAKLHFVHCCLDGGGCSRQRAPDVPWQQHRHQGHGGLHEVGGGEGKWLLSNSPQFLRLDGSVGSRCHLLECM